MAVVLDLLGRVEADPGGKVHRTALRAERLDLDLEAGGESAGKRRRQAAHGEGLEAGETEARRALAAGNSSGTMPMPIRFERWMRSYDSAITARTPWSAGPFAAQSRDEPEPYSLPASTTSGTPSAA